MTFERPLWLWLLLALPLLFWLHRHLRAPREVVVSSVDALRGASPAARGDVPRRTLDADLALLLSAVVLLALAAAGLRAGAASPSILVAVDTSASMRVRPDPASQSDLLALAWRGAREAVAQVAPDAELVVVTLDAPESAVHVTAAVDAADEDTVPVPLGERGAADGLPGTLAPVLARARRDGFPGVLLVTDRALALGRDVVVSGPGVTPDPVVAVLGAVLDGDEARVSVFRRGDDAPAVLETSIDGAPATRIGVPAGEGPVEVRCAAPARGGAATYRVVGADAHDGPQDALRVRRVGGARHVRISGPGAAAPRQRALLAALGIAVTAGSSFDAADAEIVVGGPLAAPAGDDPPRIQVAVAGGEDAGVSVRAARGTLSAARVAASGTLADAVPGPGVTFERTGVLELSGPEPAGTWTAADGIVAAVLQRRIVTTLDPEATSSSWHADASFPVFYLRAFDLLTGGPDRLESVDALPLAEVVRGDVPPPPAEPARVTTLIRPGAAGHGGAALPTVLALIAAAAIGGVLLRGTGRFSGARRPPVAAP